MSYIFFVCFLLAVSRACLSRRTVFISLWLTMAVASSITLFMRSRSLRLSESSPINLTSPFAKSRIRCASSVSVTTSMPASLNLSTTASRNNTDTIILSMVIKSRNLCIMISKTYCYSLSVLSLKRSILTVATMFLCTKCLGYIA